jgi:hypothetical protein
MSLATILGWRCVTEVSRQRVGLARRGLWERVLSLGDLGQGLEAPEDIGEQQSPDGGGD